MIDKNGRIGGKVNVIDLFIVLVLIAGICMAVVRRSHRENVTVTHETVYITFNSTEIRNFVADKLVTGGIAYDASENNYLGVITDVEFGEPYEYVSDDKKDTVAIRRPDSVSTTFTTKTEGDMDGNGVVINGTRYAVGHTMVLYAGEAKVYVKICDIYRA